MKKLLLLLAFVALPASAMDINTASSKELQGIKGIGPSKAKAIVEHRQANGPFKSIDDLAKVKGFNAKSVEKFKGDLSVGKAEKVSAKEPSASASKK